MGDAPKAPSFARTEVPEVASFPRKDGKLHCEGVSLAAIALAQQTPTYVYSGAEIDTAFGAIRSAMAAATDRDVLIAYAIKANANMAILARLAGHGCGADIVSGGELLRAKTAGIDPSRIVFSGVGKRAEEIRAAIESGIRAIHVESVPELDVVASEARALGTKARIALRVNPDVDAETHPYIATGLHGTKFGLELDVARSVLGRIVSSPDLQLEGVACHIGSQLGSTAPLTEAVAILGRFALECRAAGASLRSLDVGGGWPMHYGCEAAPYPPPLEFGRAIAAGLRQSGATEFDLITEPGRALVGPAGVLLTRVLYVKTQGTRRFVVVDAAMTELLRPALYEAYHAIAPVALPSATLGVQTSPCDVVGPVCESGDFLALERPLPQVQAGDLLAVYGAGAYGREMSMTYNARVPAAEVLVDGALMKVVRARPPVESLWAHEHW